jgi:hypothetical protein
LCQYFATMAVSDRGQPAAVTRRAPGATAGRLAANLVD